MIEVVIQPPHDRLDKFVQAARQQIRRHLGAAPDRRLDLLKGYPNLDDVACLDCGHGRPSCPSGETLTLGTRWWWPLWVGSGLAAFRMLREASAYATFDAIDLLSEASNRCRLR